MQSKRGTSLLVSLSVLKACPQSAHEYLEIFREAYCDVASPRPTPEVVDAVRANLQADDCIQVCYAS
jgi:hypothetical protein